MTDRELMQQAYAVPLHEQLASVPESARLVIDDQDGMGTRFTPVGRLCHEAAAALRERLAQPEQKPVAWEDVLGAIARGWTHDDNKHKTMDVQLAVAIAKEIQDMVAAPPQRQWIGLTDEEVKSLPQWFPSHETAAVLPLIRAIEAKIKGKDT